MFGKLLNKPATEPSSETATIAARTLAEEPESDMHALKRSRVAIEAEIDGMQRQLDEANEGLRKLHNQRKGFSWEDANAYSGARPKVYAETDLGRAISEATDRSNQLRTAIEEKRAEVEKLTEKLHAIERELPGRLRREALEAALPLAFQFIDALCVAAAHEAEYVSLGGPVEQTVPWQFALAGGHGIELETIMSRWLQALKREGIRIPGDISDDSRHLPAPASVHARTQTDAGYMANSSRRGAVAFVSGFKEGYLTRARKF